MRIALVNPPYTLWMPGMEHLAQVLGHQPPMGLVSFAAYARATGLHRGSGCSAP